jgi:tryptophan synthase alpha chain
MTVGGQALTAAVLAAARAGRPARVPFLTGGFPSKETFWRCLTDLEACGADVIEIGVPFSDPVADGPVVAAASQAALAQGVDLAWIVDGLRKRKNCVPLVLMSYANPLAQYAWARTGDASPAERLTKSLELLAADLAAAGVSGVIAPDVPLEESGPFWRSFKGAGLAPIALVGPNTTAERMRAYAQTAEGYVYVVSVLGTTGVRDGLPPEAAVTLKRAREVFDLPLALGFGVKEPGQLSALEERPDAVIFGSALLRHLSAGGNVKDFMRPWL